jgi:peptide/nickel transport system substrate-binding protein
VRQAVAYALDRPALVQALFGGRAQIGNDHAFAPTYPASPDTSQVPQRTRDVDKAKQLLAAAGQPSPAVTLTCEDFTEIPQYAQLVKQQCADAGIRVNLNVESQTQYYGSGANQPWLEVPMGIVDWASRGAAGQTIAPAYTCRSVPNATLSNSGAAWNSAHWCDPRYDRLVTQFDAEEDQSRRREIAAQAARIQQDATPAVIAYWLKELRAVRKPLHGLAPGPNIVLDPAPLWLSA